jgi:hypothetical protein
VLTFDSDAPEGNLSKPTNTEESSDNNREGKSDTPHSDDQNSINYLDEPLADDTSDDTSSENSNGNNDSEAEQVQRGSNDDGEAEQSQQGSGIGYHLQACQLLGVGLHRHYSGRVPLSHGFRPRARSYEAHLIIFPCSQTTSPGK